MKKLNFLILSLIISTSGLLAQEEENVRTSHKFGFHAGSTTGIGFSYKFQPKKLGIQVVGAPFFLNNGNIFYSLGLNGLFRFQESRKIDVFAYFGNNLISVQQERMYNIGIGGGMDIHLWPKVLDLSLQLGYGIYDVNNQPLSFIAGEIGIHYVIKTKESKAKTTNGL